MKTRIGKPALKLAVAVAVASILSACGGQQFQPVATTEQEAAPGSLQISPKVDVVLVEDDTGRIQDNYSEINTDSQNFLSTLDSEGWNYHFATLRLTTPEVITQAVSSKQDPNWANASGGSQWTPAYPGEPEGGYGTNDDALNPSVFSTIGYVAPFAQYFGFLAQGQATNVLEGSEPGFYTMAQDFASSFNNKGFFRPDALLAVVLIGTGNDTSYVNYCWNGTDLMPCDQVLPAAQQCTNFGCASEYSTTIGQTYNQNNKNPEWATGTASFNYFLTQIQSAKSSAQQIKFFAATASYDSATSGDLLCAGGYATPGTRYQQMAEDLGGQSYDVCSQPLSGILSDIAQNLTASALDYVQGYLQLQTATQENSYPDLSSVVLTKYVGGNPNNPVVIPQDPNNGWEYAGDLTNQPIIVEPIPMDYESGYMLQLNGTAQLTGADYATVTYKMANGQSGS